MEVLQYTMKIETFNIFGKNLILDFNKTTDVQSNHLKKSFIADKLDSSSWLFTTELSSNTLINFTTINSFIYSFFIANLNTFPLTCVQAILSGTLTVIYGDNFIDFDSITNVTQFNYISSRGNLKLICNAIEYRD